MILPQSPGFRDLLRFSEQDRVIGGGMGEKGGSQRLKLREAERPRDCPENSLCPGQSGGIQSSPLRNVVFRFLGKLFECYNTVRPATLFGKVVPALYWRVHRIGDIHGIIRRKRFYKFVKVCLVYSAKARGLVKELHWIELKKNFQRSRIYWKLEKGESH